MSALPLAADGLRQLRRGYLICLGLIAVLYVLATVAFLANQARIDDNQRATVALCVLRADLQTRVDSSRAFLADHPNGIPGIPAKTLRDGITNQQRTIKALQGLSCPAPK